MLILWSKRTSFSGNPRPKLRFGKLAFLREAVRTRRKHVVDRVRASARQRGAMIALTRSRLPAICAFAAVALNEGAPLCGGEPALGGASTCAIRAALDLKD